MVEVVFRDGQRGLSEETGKLVGEQLRRRAEGGGGAGRSQTKRAQRFELFPERDREPGKAARL